MNFRQLDLNPRGGFAAVHSADFVSQGGKNLSPLGQHINRMPHALAPA